MEGWTHAHTHTSTLVLVSITSYGCGQHHSGLVVHVKAENGWCVCVLCVCVVCVCDVCVCCMCVCVCCVCVSVYMWHRETLATMAFAARQSHMGDICSVARSQTKCITITRPLWMHTLYHTTVGTRHTSEASPIHLAMRVLCEHYCITWDLNGYNRCHLMDMGDVCGI